VQVGNPPNPYAQDTFTLWSCRGKDREGGSVWWYMICPILEAHQDAGSGSAFPALPLQHSMKSKTALSLCKAHKLSILGTDFNIYLLLLHPQKITLLWRAINKPLMQYSSSLTACVDSPKERGQHRIYECMMSHLRKNAITRKYLLSETVCLLTGATLMAQTKHK